MPLSKQEKFNQTVHDAAGNCYVVMFVDGEWIQEYVVRRLMAMRDAGFPMVPGVDAAADEIFLDVMACRPGV